MLNDSNTKVFMLPDGITNSSLVDPNLLLTTVMNNGGFGGNGNWIWIFFLLILFGRNGWGGFNSNDGNVLGTGYLSNQINNVSGRDLLMQAINTNGTNLSQLASTLNCDVNSIKCAINQVQSAIAQVGNQVGMSSADVKNAITTGNMSLAQLLAQCCCDNKLLVQGMGYEGLIRDLLNTTTITNRINDLTNGVTQGFSATAYETAQLTCALSQTVQNGVLTLKDTTNTQTSLILAKLDAIEDSRKDREIANLTALLTASASRAERAAELEPIKAALNEIGCKQPNTITVPYQPFVTVPNCVAFNAAYGMNPYAQSGGSIWS